jgi:hypothetical protein
LFTSPLLIRGPARGIFVFLLLLPLAFYTAMLSGCRSHTTVPDEPTAGKILSTAESTFVAMKERDYAGIWASLSAYSRDTIVDDTIKAIAKGGSGLPPREGIEGDFREGGPVGKSYWDGILRRFDPDKVLKDSRWEMGEVAGNRATVHITYKKAEKPAVILLLKEDGAWKTGLVESFWEQPAR